MQQYEDARRQALALWESKGMLLNATQAKFNKSHKVSKAIGSLCRNDPTCIIRLFADKSACQYADLHGDDLFKTKVGGQTLQAVTQWFYGFPTRAACPPSNRTELFSAEEIRLFERVRTKGLRFADNVVHLPYVDCRTVGKEKRKFEHLISKAQSSIDACSPLFCAYQILLTRIPINIALWVLSFCD